MNESILKYRPESPLSGDLGVKCKLAELAAAARNHVEALRYD